jgi:hypothetical protein
MVRMNTRLERIAIEIVAALITVSAVSGGVGLIGGGIALPLEWLADTPFSSYIVPGVILALIVGGSALVAVALMLLRHTLAVPVALGAGCIQAGWIVGELVLVGSRGSFMVSCRRSTLALERFSRGADQGVWVPFGSAWAVDTNGLLLKPSKTAHIA